MRQDNLVLRWLRVSGGDHESSGLLHNMVVRIVLMRVLWRLVLGGNCQELNGGCM